jgi:CDP-diacylglycerol--glycerol-3-phosphate 3-phosphatidyltransferase
VVALCFLLEVGEVNAWVLLVIVSREFLVSGLRMVVASEGVVVAASNLGKWKTAITMIAICGLLLVRSIPASMLSGIPAHTVFDVLLWVAVALTAWSGIDYFVSCWPYVSGCNNE